MSPTITGRYITPDGIRALPQTEIGWKERYNWLADWYSGLDYTPQDHTLLKLFHAVDPSGNLLAVTKRICQDAKYVIDTDARLLASGDWSLELAPTAPAGTDLDRALAIWTRSRLQEQKHAWVLQCAMLGDYYLEAVREVDGAVRIYGYDPRWCDVTYDAAGLDVTRLTMTLASFTDPGLSLLSTMRRTVTPTTIERSDLTTDAPDGWADAVTGTHTLGVAPVVHLRFAQLAGLPEHGLWAGHGMEPQLWHLDSMIGQMHAIFARYAHPHIVIKGSSADGDDIEAFGRIFDRLAPDADISYLEPTLAGLQPMMESIRYHRDTMREQIPEYVFGAGANTSGRAYEMRMDALKRKMREVQGRLVRAFARLTAYAYCLETGTPYDPSIDYFRVRTPPLLPQDEPRTIRSVVELRSAGLLTRKSAIEVLQAIGIVDEDEDADEYVARLDAEPAAPTVTATRTPTLDDTGDTE